MESKGWQGRETLTTSPSQLFDFSNSRTLKNNYMGRHYHSKGIDPITLLFTGENKKLEEPFNFILSIEAYWYNRFLAWIPPLYSILFFGYDYISYRKYYYELLITRSSFALVFLIVALNMFRFPRRTTELVIVCMAICLIMMPTVFAVERDIGFSPVLQIGKLESFPNLTNLD
jgi:hypothetical protein